MAVMISGVKSPTRQGAHGQGGKTIVIKVTRGRRRGRLAPDQVW